MIRSVPLDIPVTTSNIDEHQPIRHTAFEVLGSRDIALLFRTGTDGFQIPDLLVSLGPASLILLLVELGRRPEQRGGKQRLSDLSW